MREKSESFVPDALITLGWAGAWHFSSWLMDATIKSPQWREIAAIVTGVTMMYPRVDALTAKAARMLGLDAHTVKLVRIALALGYFVSYVAGGIGTVIARAVDDMLFGHYTGHK